MTAEKFELDAIVELFGHQRIAGRVTEESIGVATFIRIDVPETPSQPSFTRLVHPNAIYAINPVTYDVMKHMAEQIHQKPIESWDVQKMHEKLLLLKAASQENKSESQHSFEEDFNG